MIILLTAAHGRHEVFKLFLRSIPDFVYTIVVGSDDENCKYFRDNKINGKYIIYKNLPLGEKWNRGLTELRRYMYDYLIISGSDDIFSHDLWEWYKTLDVHYAGLLDFYFYENGRIKYFPGFMRNRFGEPNGAGRALHRHLVEAVKYKLWNDNINIGLDASMTVNISRFTYTSKFIKLNQHGFVALDIKTHENLHSASEYDGVWLDSSECKYILEKLNLTYEPNSHNHI